MGKVIIVGHKNPDTDSIVSAIAAQEYFSKVLGKDAQAFRAGELNNESKFILEKMGVQIPSLVASVEEEDSVALVDHNEPSQVFDQLNYENVDFIIDHHKMAVHTDKPITCRVEPIGSTSSLIAKMFFEKGIDPTEQTAKLLLAGILSDMLNFTSPTTTQEDKDLAEKLNGIAKMDLEAFVAEMFKAKSSLEGISTEDIVTLDYKNFEMGAHKVGVGTWETTGPDGVLEKKDEIIAALAQKKKDQNLDYIYFMIVDILKQVCFLLVIDEKEQALGENVFGKTAEQNIIELPGVVSRKKQIIPQLTEALSK
jgi:manganese-dependent inorganic pyrophosphatase